MPVYNSEKYLKLAIDSILNQTYSNFELIVFDDASSDGGPEILKSYNDERLKVYYAERNHGYVYHLNKGIEIAQGQYIARMDSDDISLPSRLEEQIKVFIENDNIDLVFSDSLLIDKDNNPICDSWRPSLKWVIRALPYLSYIPHPSVMVKKSTYYKYNGYDENKSPAEDLDLWSRMKNGGAQFFYIKKCLLKYRINPNSVQNVKGNIAFQANYYINRINQCIAHNHKLAALKFLIRDSDNISYRDKALLLMKIISPFYLSVVRGYLLAKKRIGRVG